MTHRKPIIAALLCATMAMGACSSPPSASTSSNETLASAKGREAALKALEMPSGSMQQEKAMLHIRAIEHKIRQAGDTLAADAYLRAAQAVLDSASVSVR